MIRFFNTLTGKMEPFTPLNSSEVGLYTCGPTVYDYAHIGNFRTFVFEDLLRRFLEFQVFKVKHVMNVTDVDDKTIAGAAREGKKLDDFTSVYIQAFQEDLKTLNILPSTEQPRATREIHGPGGMIELIQKLIQNGIAYESEGSVYYRIAGFPDYGKLSKKNLEKNIKGARVDVDEYDKEEGSDFVLWKKTKPGEPSWDSPWGQGRPGWHIECSAMSMKYLGETFDIHAGGEDLIFPHHENEIAQSAAATGKPFVKYWLHSKFLLVDGKKMSKKEKNFYTLRDLLAKGYDPMAIRYALISTHYRTPLNFTLDGLKEASEVIKRLDDCYATVLSRGMDVASDAGGERANNFESRLNEIKKDILEALSDDLNVSRAIASLLEGIKILNMALTAGDLNEQTPRNIAVQFFHEMDKLFGFGITFSENVPANIIKKMRERSEARQRINKQYDKSAWAVSDQLRDEIQNMGWIVKDGRPDEPSTLKKKRRTWD